MAAIWSLDPFFFLFSLCLSPASACQEVPNQTEFSSPGDYILAGLFSCHKSVPSITSTPQFNYCDRDPFNSHGYHLLQGMRMAIAEINNSSVLLPNVTLGYQLFDTCSSSANIYGTLKSLTQGVQSSIKMQNNLTDYQPQAIAMVGPSSSSFASATASILGKFLIPQISYSASMELLSQKKTYPSFLRTIPSDKLQVEAMLNLLQRFNWTWVAILGSDDDYGRQGSQTLATLATNSGICVPYQGLIPYSTNGTNLKKLVASIVQTRVNVTVVFADYLNARTFFQEVVNAGVTNHVWIASESWSVDPQIASLPNIERIGSVLGVSVANVYFPKLLQFEIDYVTSPKTKNACGDGCNQACTYCQSFTLQNMSIPTLFDMSATFDVYSAVYAIAHGLHELLNCGSGHCRKGTYYPWQLLEQVKKVNFSLYNKPIYFDSNGNPATGYDIVMWSWDKDAPNFRVIGTYSKTTQRLQLNGGLQWHTKDNTVPVSACSKECDIGERRVQTGFYACCFYCIPCPKMSYVNKSDPYTCQSCGSDQWSPIRSEICFERTTEYLTWSEPSSIMLLSIVSLLLLAIYFIAAIFLKNLSTPVVKSAGGKMCLVMLLSLAVSCSTLYCYFGKPGVVTCLVRQPIFAVSFTICFSCIVTHSFQIVCIFKMAVHMPRMYNMWIRKNGSNVFIIMATALQVLISLAWVVGKPSRPIKDYSTFPDKIILKCSEMGSLGSIAEILYIGFLCMVCFIFCYMGKDLPENYNEAKFISFSLLVYVFSWIGFFTTYIVYQGKYIVAVNVGSILLGVLGVLVGYFTPKCYIILFRPELNTAEHFKTAIQSYTMKRLSQE